MIILLLMIIMMIIASMCDISFSYNTSLLVHIHVYYSIHIIRPPLFKYIYMIYVMMIIHVLHMIIAPQVLGREPLATCNIIRV